MIGAVALYAISDVHVRHAANRELVAALPAHPDDWLLLAGDVSEDLDDLRWTFDVLRPRFAGVVWTTA